MRMGREPSPSAGSQEAPGAPHLFDVDGASPRISCATAPVEESIGPGHATEAIRTARAVVGMTLAMAWRAVWQFGKDGGVCPDQSTSGWRGSCGSVIEATPSARAAYVSLAVINHRCGARAGPEPDRSGTRGCEGQALAQIGASNNAAASRRPARVPPPPAVRPGQVRHPGVPAPVGRGRQAAAQMLLGAGQVRRGPVRLAESSWAVATCQLSGYWPAAGDSRAMAA